MAGENAALSRISAIRDRRTVQVTWLRPEEEVTLDEQHLVYMGRLWISVWKEIRQEEAMMTRSALEEWDSGLYQCCIQIYQRQ